MGTSPLSRRKSKGVSIAEDLIEAVVMLRAPSSGRPPAPAASKAIAESVLAKVASETGLSPTASTVFENMHSFSVCAPQRFLDAIAREDEVAQVLPNELAQSPLIEPVKKAPVKLPR